MSPVRARRLRLRGRLLRLLLLSALLLRSLRSLSLIALCFPRAVAAFLLLLLEELVTGHAAL